MGVFIDAGDLPDDVDGFCQLVFLLLVYGYILGQASNLISDGSELLLLVPALAGVVGSVVLPILGAVPDGAIVLFSGMGPNAQSQLTVGVGALAGSTIMLLTFPWALSIIGGRVDIDPVTNLPAYKKPKGASASWSKLAEPHKLSLNTGVHVTPAVKVGAGIMLATSLTYLIIQVPAFIFHNSTQQRLAHEEKPWALTGLILAMVAFAAYLWYQWKISASDEVKEDRILEIAVDNISKGRLSLMGVIGPDFLDALKEHTRSTHTHMQHGGVSDSYTRMSSTEYGSIQALRQDIPQHVMTRLESMLRPFFLKYDADRSGHIDAPELTSLFKDLGETLSADELREIMTKYDKDKSGMLDFEEFKQLVLEYSLKVITTGGKPPSRRASLNAVQQGGVPEGNNGQEEEDENEEEEMPEDLKDLPWKVQQMRVLLRSTYMMVFGTALVLIFSDPMVEVLSELGDRTGIPAFYISFILSPLVSNASELIASYNYSLKKTTKTITISLATLIGAGIMNNTFVLSVFLLLVYGRGLAWQFSAETIAILFVEVVVGIVALTKSVHTVATGFMILSLYPISLLLVYLLENVFGFD